MIPIRIIIISNQIYLLETKILEIKMVEEEEIREKKN